MDREEKRRQMKARRKRKLDNQRAMLAIIGVVIVLFFAFLIGGIRMRRQIKENDARTASLKSAISAEEEKANSIGATEDVLSTESFIREAAKERLGLVESDEVIYKSGQNK